MIGHVVVVGPRLAAALLTCTPSTMMRGSCNRTESFALEADATGGAALRSCGVAGWGSMATTPAADVSASRLSATPESTLAPPAAAAAAARRAGGIVATVGAG